MKSSNDKNKVQVYKMLINDDDLMHRADGGYTFRYDDKSKIYRGTLNTIIHAGAKDSCAKCIDK